MLNNVNDTSSTDMSNLFAGDQDTWDEKNPNPAQVTDTSTSAQKTAYLSALASMDVNKAKSVDNVAAAAQHFSTTYQTEPGSEDNYRTQLAAADPDAAQKAIAAVSSDPTLRGLTNDAQSFSVAAEVEMQKQQTNRAKSIIEQKAIDRIHELATVGDDTQAQLLLNNINNGGPLNYLSDLNTKQLILQREIDKAQVGDDNQSWFADLVYFLSACIPLTNSTAEVGNVDLPGMHKRSWLDSVFTGKRQLDEASAIFRLPTDQFSDYVSKHLVPNVTNSASFASFTDKGKVLDILSNMQHPVSPMERNVWNGLENIGLVEAVRPLLKAVSVPLLLVKNGARKSAEAVVADAVKSSGEVGMDAALKRTGMTEDQLTSNIVPTALNTDPAGAPTVAIGPNAMRALNRGEELLSSLGDIVGSGRHTPSELAAAIQSYTDKISEDFGDRLADVATHTVKDTTGQTSTQAEFIIGRRGGGGFKSVATMKRALKDLSYDAVPKIDESGQVFGSVKLTVPETGFYTSPLMPNVSGPIDRYLRSAKNLSDPVLADMAAVAGNTQNALMTKVITPILSKLDNLRGEEKATLGQVLGKSRADRHWFTPEELDDVYMKETGRTATQKEHEAYQAAIDINDIEYLLRNEDTHRTKAHLGQKTVSFSTPLGDIKRLNAYVDVTPSATDARRSYDATRGVHHLQPLTDDMVEQLRDGNQVLVRLESPFPLADGTRIDTFMVNKNDLKIEDLKLDQTPYNEGGHTLYTSKYFAKQADYFSQPDTPNIKNLVNPNVYATFETRAQAEWWTRQMEAARLLAKEGEVTGEELAARIEEETALGVHPGLPTGAQFVTGLEKGWWKIDTPFEATFDREMPTEYLKVDTDAIDFSDRSERGIDGYLRTNGRPYYGRRGEQLPDFMGELAPTLDSFKTLDMAVKSAARLSSLSDYKEAAIARWANTYKGFLTNYDSKASDVRLFTDGILKEGGPTLAKIKTQAEAQRDIIKRVIGWRTDADRASELYAMRIADFVGGHDPGNSLRGKAAATIMDWYANKSPISFIRGFVFNTTLGMFNPAQLFLQMSTAVSTLVMAGPARAWKAMYSAIPLRMFLMKGGSDELLEEFARRGLPKAMGFDTKDEFKLYMNHVKSSGFFDFGTTHLLINSQGPSAAYSRIGKTAHDIAAAGRFFFNEGEVWNRLVASRLSWDDVRIANPKLSVKSEEFMRKWAGRSEDWAFQMSKNSEAQWQRGITSIPTQFWAYNARMLDFMLGKTFTPAQRTRLIISQLALAGASGTPITYEISRYFKGKTGSGDDLDTWQGMVNRGLLDSLVYHLTGADVSLGQRVGTGEFVGDTIRDIFNMSAYGEVSAADVFSGVAGSIATRTFGAFTDVAKWAIAEGGGDSGMTVTRDAVIKLASNITTINNLNKAYLIYRYGVLTSSKGAVLATDIPTSNAFSQALGFQSGETLKANDVARYMNNRKEMVSDLAKQIVQFRTKAFATPDGITDLNQQINLLTKMYPADIRQQAILKANKWTPAAVYDSMKRSYERAKQEEQITNSSQSSDDAGSDNTNG